MPPAQPPAGDAVLMAWDRVLAAKVPRGSTVLRLGGDEFVVVLPTRSDTSGMLEVAARGARDAPIRRAHFCWAIGPRRAMRIRPS